MFAQTKKFFFVLFLALALAGSFVGCGDATQEIPMLGGIVVVKPYKAHDLLAMGYYQVYFNAPGLYVVTIELNGKTLFKCSQMVTEDSESKMRSYGHMDFYRAIAQITITGPDGRTDQIQYDMGNRLTDEVAGGF